MKATIIINRGEGAKENLKGTVIREATTHVLVAWEDNIGKGEEWFARNSKMVSTTVKES